MKKIYTLLLLSIVLQWAYSLNTKAHPLADDGVKVPVLILAEQTRQISFQKQSLKIHFISNVDVNVTTEDSWMKLRRSGKTVIVDVSANTDMLMRQGRITFCTKDGGLTRFFVLEQKGETFANYVPDDKLKVVSATDNNHQPGADISLSIDGDLSTCYHSVWGGGNVTEDNPAILTYNLNDEHVDYITYVPRPGGGNGDFGKLKLYYKQSTSTSDGYTLWGAFDFQKSASPTNIYLGEKGLDHVTSFRFEVTSGNNWESSERSYASCAEMQFHKYIDWGTDTNVFADKLLTKLKDGVSAADIKKIKSPFIRNLAERILNGEYNEEYRVGEYPCLLSTQVLAQQLSCPGKSYDVTQGVTGVLIKPGKTAVIVEGVSDSVKLSLEVFGWTVPEKSYLNRTAYSLHNGINVIEHNVDWDGLAYINYFSDTPEKYGNIKVHIVNAVQNGVLASNKSNQEMSEILSNAKYATIDLVGERVHSVWEVKALQQYCDGAYRRYINVLDTLIAWEHRLIGLEKYNRIPKNKTLAYVNYDYYMYQGGLGVTFKYDTQYRVCSPTVLMTKDDDAIWGLSHEWGHQHQMHPYFCWAGLSECSNNMNSCYNVLHMGYSGSRISNGWESAKKSFVTADPKGGTVSQARSLAYQNRAKYAWSQKMYDQFAAMKDSTITKRSADEAHSLSVNEVYVEETLAPFFMLHCYFSQNGCPDFTPDLYESLRNTETDNDKYALLAAAQNGRKDRFAAFKAAYPASSWVTDGYVSESSTTWQNSVPYIMNYIVKASKLSGYNLFPFFDKWGFLRNVALYINDYGEKYYCMTKEMYDEFKADMDDRTAGGEFKLMPDDMFDAISKANIPHFPTPNIPN